jgi:hypothetical protein
MFKFDMAGHPVNEYASETSPSQPRRIACLRPGGATGGREETGDSTTFFIKFAQFGKNEISLFRVVSAGRVGARKSTRNA